MAVGKSIRFPELLLSEIEVYQKAVGENFTDSVLMLIRLGLTSADENSGLGTRALVEKLNDITRFNVQIAALTSAIASQNGGDELLEEAESHAQEMLKDMGL